MATAKTQTTKKDAAHTEKSRPQKKDIGALLHTRQSSDYFDSLKDTLKWKIIFHDKDVRKAKKFKYDADRLRFVQHLLIDRIKEGIDADAFEKVTEAYDIPLTLGYQVMRIPQSTYRRRIAKGKLLPDESDRVYRFAELMTQATDMMQQNSDRAQTWFKTKMDVFDGETPLHHAMTEIGAREVEDLIGRIRHGVFS